MAENIVILTYCRILLCIWVFSFSLIKDDFHNVNLFLSYTCGAHGPGGVGNVTNGVGLP